MTNNAFESKVAETPASPAFWVREAHASKEAADLCRVADADLQRRATLLKGIPIDPGLAAHHSAGCNAGLARETAWDGFWSTQRPTPKTGRGVQRRYSLWP